MGALTHRLILSLAAASALSLSGCDKKKDDDLGIALSKAKCAADDECADGFICETDGDDKVCKKGERSAEEKAKMAADEKAKKAAEAEAKKPKGPKEGESTLTVRLCPGFINTLNATGTIHAKHQETGKYHPLHMSLELKEGEAETEFTFPSLPLGKYDVTVDYGILVKGRPDVVKLKCSKKAEPCRDEIIREMEVVAFADTYKPGAKDKDDKPVYKDCDFDAE